MHSQSNEPADHRRLHNGMVIGFADLARDIRDRFAGINQQLDAIELRLDAIEAHLRRINPNGHQA